MRMRAFAMAVAAAFWRLRAAPPRGTTASPGGSTAANPCAKSNLTLVTPGQLTIGTDNPAFDPFFQGPTGHEWTGQFNHDPYNDQGFEDATAYAVAQQLGFTKDQVNWVAVPFNNSYKPGPKNFDFYLAQVSYTPAAREGRRPLGLLLRRAGGGRRAPGHGYREGDVRRGAEAVHVRRPDRDDEL